MAGDLRNQFLLAEYDALRREIELHLNTLNKISQLTAAGSAAVFVFALSTNGLNLHWMVAAPLYLSPFLLSLICCYHYFSLFGVIRMIASYIRTVEEEVFIDRPGLGWQHYIAGNDVRRIPIRRSRYFFWGSLIAFNGALGCFLVWFTTHRDSGFFSAWLSAVKAVFNAAGRSC